MKTDPHPLRLAVIGAGSMGRNHARILASLPSVDLVGIVDPDAATREQVARLAQTEGLSDVDEVIARGIDAAVVAVPTVEHHRVASRLIDAGVHLLIEKPIAATTAEAHDLIARASGK
ncbi:MAG: Gfo/Idh/MocA family oxidoreductase, partial [Beijerinckiaceae bacterium]|nr:Gfo/Idh/MocA family oxidoreductase [Beijerinckiaceae bacterium]